MVAVQQRDTMHPPLPRLLTARLRVDAIPIHHAVSRHPPAPRKRQRRWRDKMRATKLVSVPAALWAVIVGADRASAGGVNVPSVNVPKVNVPTNVPKVNVPTASLPKVSVPTNIPKVSVPASVPKVNVPNGNVARVNAVIQKIRLEGVPRTAVRSVASPPSRYSRFYSRGPAPSGGGAAGGGSGGGGAAGGGSSGGGAAGGGSSYASGAGGGSSSGSGAAGEGSSNRRGAAGRGQYYAPASSSACGRYPYPPCNKVTPR